jgi:hypothetical protein
MPVLKVKNENGEWIRLPYVIKIVQKDNVITGLTEEQIKALNEMTCEIDKNGELNITYDNTVLDLDFTIEGTDLIVISGIQEIDFNINENGELEVSY